MKQKKWWLAGALYWAVVVTQAQIVEGQKSDLSKGVVVVLAGGGAKGFAHLAVLRQLEKDHVPIARIVGTSMGAVIGSLYASGMRTDDIERVIGGLDPAKVALDQVDRNEVPPSVRAYQQQYPINLEFGLKSGGLSFARGVSDGQRFMALLQRLFVHLPPNVDFNELKIPLRVIATRYRDGEIKVFDKGALHLVVRASMAAPGIFSPVEIDGDEYVDGGLVANLPIEVALQEGAEQIVASYLGQGPIAQASADNALVVANHMITLLLQQNERRNLGMLRPQDVLVHPQLEDVGFADFNRSAEIVERGYQALEAVKQQWQRMVQRLALMPVSERTSLSHDQREIRIVEVRVSGQQYVPAEFVQSQMVDLLDKPFDASEVAQHIDVLYTSGHFEQVSYTLEHLRGARYVLNVQVREKSYGPHYLKMAIGFSTERNGVTQFSSGVGYRRPWLTPQGLELQLDARVGTLNEFNARLIQPIDLSWALEAGVGSHGNMVPVYEPEELGGGRRKFAYMHDRRDEVYALIGREFGHQSVMKLGVVQAAQRYGVDITRTLIGPNGQAFSMPDLGFNYSAIRWQWGVDLLDAVSFPTEGYAVDLFWESGISGASYSRSRLRGLWARTWGSHVLNMGATVSKDKAGSRCSGTCIVPTPLFMGGFQFMGAYRMGEINGDQLAHAYATYMYRLSNGGVLRQKSFIGVVGEVGDAWNEGDHFRARHSLSLFIGMDSKIGDLYIGAARGSGGVANLFLQLGRRFQF